LPNSNNIKENIPENTSEQVRYRRVPSSRGSVWITQAFALFRASLGVWFGIVAFIMLLLIIPVISNIVALLMPVGIGGLMIGCQQASKTHSLKFEHLFAGIQSNAKELIILSAIYAIASIGIVFASYYVLLLLGIDFSQVLPENMEQMSSEQMIEWIRSLDQTKLLPMLLLGILVWMGLMIPLFMAYWFAPALIVLNKVSALKALKLSFNACKDNFLPFLIYGLVGFAYLMGFFMALSIFAAIIQPLFIILLFAGYLAIFAITLASIYTSYTDIFEQQKPLSEDNNGSDNADNSDSSMIA